MIINGKELANAILEDLRKKVIKLQHNNVTPRLAVILIGDNPSSLSYIRQKQLKAEQIGAKLSLFHYDEHITEQKIIEQIKSLNHDSLVHGIIVQRPFPKHLDKTKITLATSPHKDIDGFHPDSKFTPPIALAISRILESIYSTNKNEANFTKWLSEKKIVIVGKGETAGKPIINYLHGKNIYPIVVDRLTTNKAEKLKDADIIISAIGQINSLKLTAPNKKTILLGVGMSRGKDNKMHADYDEKIIKNLVRFYTTVPGGVGPVNVAMLMKNLIQAASHSH